MNRIIKARLSTFTFYFTGILFGGILFTNVKFVRSGLLLLLGYLSRFARYFYQTLYICRWRYLLYCIDLHLIRFHSCIRKNVSHVHISPTSYVNNLSLLNSISLLEFIALRNSASSVLLWSARTSSLLFRRHRMGCHRLLPRLNFSP